MTGLGETLREAREAKSLSIHGVERELRISRKYLQALEDEDYDSLPAPVYARGFLRTYAQFLGLDPAELMPLFQPAAQREKVVEPLPELAPPQPQWANWLIIGAVVLVVALAGLYVAATVVMGGGDGGADAADAVTPVPESAAAVAPVQMPDVRGKAVDEAVAEVAAAGLSYVVVEVRNDDQEPGTVYAQDPDPGDEVPEGQVVALTVSRAEEPQPEG